MGCSSGKEPVQPTSDDPKGATAAGGRPTGTAPVFRAVDPYRTNTADPEVVVLPPVSSRMAAVPPIIFVKSVAKIIEDKSGPDFYVRAKRAHDWVVTHIQTDGTAGGVKKFDQTVDDVIKSGLAKSEGFANVFKALCDNLLIPCEVIGGCIRGPAWSLFKPGKGNDLTKKNHSWNKVQLLGVWYPVDCSFDAGYLDAKGLVKAHYSTTYFLTDPQQFVRDHFPLQASNQLLVKPLTAAQFSELFVTRQTFWTVVAALDPLLPRLATAPEGKLDVTFTLRKGYGLSFYVRDADPQTKDNYENSSYVLPLPPLPPAEGQAPQQVGMPMGVSLLLGTDGQQCRAFLGFPRAGKFLVRMFWRKTGEKLLESCAEFGVNSKRAGPKYPTQLEHEGVGVESPLEYPLKVGLTYEFRVRMTAAAAASTAEKLALVIDGKFNNFVEDEMVREEATGMRVYTKSVEIEEESKIVKICAASSASTSYSEVVRWDVIEIVVPPSK